MKSLAHIGLFAIALGLAVDATGQTVCTLNGKEIVFSKRQTLTFPKGVDGEIEAPRMKTTLIGEEEITINGTRFRQYGDMVEVNGNRYPVGSEEVLLVKVNGDILISRTDSAEISVTRPSIHTLNGKRIASTGDQKLTFPKGIGGKVEAREMRATLTGEEEITVDGEKIRAWGRKVEVNGTVYHVEANEILQLGARTATTVAAGAAEAAGTRASIYAFNEQRILFIEVQTLTFPKGIAGKVEAPAMKTTLTGEKEVTINGSGFRVQGDRVEVDGKGYPVGTDDILKVMANGDILIRGAGGKPTAGAGESFCMLNGRKLLLSGWQTLSFPEGISGTVEASGMKATLTGEEKITIEDSRFRVYGEKVEVDGKAYPVGEGEALHVSEDSVTIHLRRR